ncbi:hypothetical protein SAMN04487898_104356 [Pedobacter sp. ok626]|uniref:hypothetical protein n=1 Tax=Pedobacter sp. ok626 TaxID=1761882 RepID=UPI000887EB5A|nr:hypothetical protein [Pedobacter sp. ok626]SDJ82115.1 hypothetical protein SAMN04487898_104356 [Pedobacter sp. ok626]
MNKILKNIGVTTLILICLLLLIIGLFWGNVKWNNYSKEKEAIRYQKEVCDTMTTVNRKIEFVLDGFSKKETKQVRFYLVRNKSIIRDSMVKADVNPAVEYQNVMLPFDKISIIDQVIVKAGNRYFLLTGLSYRAKYNYGMFGPVGDCECTLDGFEKINGTAAGYGWLIKKYGLLNYP